jgi:hypothetical protein
VSVPRTVRPENVGESTGERPSCADDETTPGGKDADIPVI